MSNVLNALCAFERVDEVERTEVFGESLAVLIAYWEKRERGVVFSRPLRALRAA